MRNKVALLAPCLLLFFLIQEAKSWQPPLEIDVVSIKFDFESGYADDALDICKNASSDIATPEWLPPSRNNPLAYIKSQTNRHIVVTFTHNQGAGDVCTMVVKANAGGYYPGTVQETEVSFPSCGTTASAELTLSGGSTPSYVQKWGFSLYWYVTEENEQVQNPNLSLGTTGNHLYYTLLAAPQNPMSEPWTDVLDYACVWARNQSTSANAAKKITEEIYDMGDTDGDIDYNYASYYCTDYDELKLADFLDDVNSINDVKVNCTDCGNIVNVFTAAVGCQSHSKRIWYGINTKDIDPIGSSYSWVTVSWSYHQYGWLNSLVNDASLRLDRYGTPRVPTNMSQSYYNSLLINGNPPTNSQVYTTQIVD